MIDKFIKEIKEFYSEVYSSDLNKLSLEELENYNNKMKGFYLNELVCKNESEEDKIYSFAIYQILGFYSIFITKAEDSKIYFDYIDKVIEAIPKGIEELRNTILNYINDVSRPISKLLKNNIEINNSTRKIVMESNLDNYNYLYYYGENITQNQIKIVDFFNKVDTKKIDDMANCTANAFIRGMKNNGIDINSKEYIVVWYDIGLEKLAKRIVEVLEGKLEVILRKNEIPFSKQVDYNHRYDYNFYLTPEYIEKYINTFEKEVMAKKEIFKTYGGPIAIELFGENRFIPENGKEIYQKSNEITEIKTKFDSAYRNIFMKNIRKDTSFCIISYPCPEIGKKFEEIFEETIKINTLDNEKYAKIHQYIIDTLNKAEKVHITGKNGNKTDLTVYFAKLNNPEKETIFENCLADVNVPVGEVFTSPKLTGTNGILNVSEIYLNGWKFENLYLKIKDGFIEEYNCSNFKTDKENKDYINEHILYDHKSLPMGEFAIGTNTHAYVMGNKYKINDKLDILIAEKTGPHFAFGDTCFSMEEDTDTFNPDGKKMIAKDNEVTIKRLSKDMNEVSHAYFGCHTDITIPYYELGDIVAITKNMEEFYIIKDGKFVLKGTEELNIEGI